MSRPATRRPAPAAVRVAARYRTPAATAALARANVSGAGLTHVTRVTVVRTSWSAAYAADPAQPAPPTAADGRDLVTLIVRAGQVAADGLVGRREPYRYHWESTLLAPPVAGASYGSATSVLEPGSAWPAWLARVPGAQVTYLPATGAASTHRVR